MEDSSFSLGLTQLDTNSVIGFVLGVFDYEEPNFVENRSKFRNDPNKMKDIRKAATEKSKKAVENLSRLSKTDDSGRPRLPKGMKYRIRKVPVHLLHFGSYCNRKFGEGIKNYLGEEVVNLFRQIIFDSFLDIPNCNYQDQLSKCLLMLEIEQDNLDKIDVCVKGTTLKFTIIKYAIISGLKCSGNIEEHLFPVTSKSTLMTKYFSGSKSSVKRSFFIKRFKVVGIKVKYEKFMVGMFSKFVYNNIRSTHEEVQTLDLQMIEGFQLKEAESFEEFSTVPPTEILKKAGLITDASTSHLTKTRKIVCFDSTTAKEQVCQKTPSFISTRTVPTQKIVSSVSEHVYAEKRTPSSSLKSICQDNSDEKWNDIKLFLQSYVDTKINFLHDLVFKQHQDSNEKMDKQHAELIQMLKHNSQKNEKQEGEGKIGNVPSKEDVEDIEIFKTLKEKGKKDVEGFSEDNTTASLDAFVEFMVNHNFDNTNVKTSTTMHVHNDHMDVEGVSDDIGPATLKCLIATVKNQKPDNNNVGTSNMQIDYSSTLSESAQVELDTILKVIAAPVNDVPIEVVPTAGPVVNQHNISDSQLPLDFSDAVVATHQVAKIPAKVAKRIRTRSKVFKSPYTSEYASSSKAIKGQIEEQQQQFAFDDFLISDTMSSSVIEEFKQWVEEGLLKFHAKNHIDVIFYHLRKKSTLRSDQDYRFTTTYCFFKNYIEKTYSRYYEDDTDTILTIQQDYAESVRVALIEEAITHIIKGYCMPSGLP
ncbi:hypothetical protein P3S67_010563 [Capsicum chacoense]